ncbi:MAG TPA: HAMP domain-containing sensor histidine kinase [Acidimicrobiia bacterium]|nr:HAMP domain-containing sensor histidine kinase [Acidimicrobiia bacterium]
MRRWLSLYALSITSIVIIAFLVPLAVLIRDLAVDRAMNAAEREAQTVARFASTIDDSPESIAALENTLAAAPGTSVMLSDGTVLGASLPAGVDLAAARELGQAYRQSLDESEAVVVPVLRGAGAPWVIVIAVPSASLTEGVASAWLVLGALGLGLIGLAFVVADRMGRAVVKPIRDLVEATHRLGKGELTVAVDPGGPSELAEVGAAFNTLTGRVSTLMDRERETAADISHRLRTPLTALKLDIEALGKHVDVSRLHHDVDELERVVSHVINEARRSVREGVGVVADLVEIVAERAEYWGWLAADQDRRWILDIEVRRASVNGHSGDFEAMLDALLGNVFAHTPAGTGYRIILREPERGLVELVVADQGPGIADEGLLERGASGGRSTGLGVDIVRGTAEAAGGKAHWESGDPAGTLVRVVLPEAGSSPAPLR